MVKHDLADWRDTAACLHQDPELFFPIGNNDEAARQVHRAKRVCGDCPVREACLTWALAVGTDYGVWGGLDEHERRSAKRRRERQRRTATEAPPRQRTKPTW